MSSRDTANVLWFDELHREDVNLVGRHRWMFQSHMALRPPPGRISTS